MNTQKLNRKAGTPINPKTQDEQRAIYLACNEDGGIVDIITAQSFEEAYDNTIGLNSGEFLIELDDENYELIRQMKEEEL